MIWWLHTLCLFQYYLTDKRMYGHFYGIIKCEACDHKTTKKEILFAGASVKRAWGTVNNCVTYARWKNLPGTLKFLADPSKGGAKASPNMVHLPLELEKVSDKLHFSTHFLLICALQKYSHPIFTICHFITPVSCVLCFTLLGFYVVDQHNVVHNWSKRKHTKGFTFFSKIKFQ